MIFEQPIDTSLTSNKAKVEFVQVDQLVNSSQSNILSSGQSSEPHKVFESEREADQTGTMETVRECPPGLDEWDSRIAKRFKSLAVKKAVYGLNSAESKEYSRLQEIRRILVSPRSGVEILHEKKRARLLQEMESAITKYVQFVKPENHPGKTSQ